MSVWCRNSSTATSAADGWIRSARVRRQELGGVDPVLLHEPGEGLPHLVGVVGQVLGGEHMLRVLNMHRPNGCIQPGDPTMVALMRQAGQAPTP